MAAPSHSYVIGLGANLGSRRANLAAALERLAGAGSIERVSALYASEPWGPPQPDYLNAAVRLASPLAPEALLERLLVIEAELGRKRDPAQRFGPRSLDLDILWASEARASETLTVPHPRLGERWFALAPLLDVAPELEPTYGPALAAAGGRRPARAPQLLEAPCAEVTRADGELRIAARAPEPEDALADALSALGRALFPASAAALRVQSVQAQGSDAEAAAHACVEQALALAAGGFAFRRASVVRLVTDACECRLLGIAAQAPGVPCRLLGFGLRVEGGEALAELQLRLE